MLPPPALPHPSDDVRALEREIALAASQLVFLARAVSHQAQGAGFPLDLAKALADFAACQARLETAMAKLAALAKTAPAQPSFPEFSAS